MFLRTKDTSDNKKASGQLTSEIWPDSGVFLQEFFSLHLCISSVE